MRDELARAYDFLARGDMGGTRVEETPAGRVVFTDELPRRLDGTASVNRNASRESRRGRAHGGSSSCRPGSATASRRGSSAKAGASTGVVMA
jgi:hypothetical protein